MWNLSFLWLSIHGVICSPNQTYILDDFLTIISRLVIYLFMVNLNPLRECDSRCVDLGVGARS